MIPSNLHSSLNHPRHFCRFCSIISWLDLTTKMCTPAHVSRYHTDTSLLITGLSVLSTPPELTFLLVFPLSFYEIIMYQFLRLETRKMFPSLLFPFPPVSYQILYIRSSDVLYPSLSCHPHCAHDIKSELLILVILIVSSLLPGQGGSKVVSDLNLIFSLCFFS